MIRCYIGLGSNLENPREQVSTALKELQSLPQSQFVAASRLYRSDPLGPPDQPDYINAVAALDTELAPEGLLDQLQQIETLHERKRLERWGPRTLDLDLLLYGQQQINTQRLQVPHAELPNRAFVLYPLAEIAPEVQLPDGTPLTKLLDQCALTGVEPIEV